MTTKYPSALNYLIASLKGLQGVGAKTAERFAFDLLDWPAETRKNLAQAIQRISSDISSCSICSCLCNEGACPFCTDSSRDQQLLCLVCSSKDVFAIEETHQYKGLYHVIGAPISPMDGRDIESLHLDKLVERIQNSPISEVIIALDSTLEGDTTALYIARALEFLSCRVTRLASGIPMGSSLQYVDGSTLAQAFLGRQHL